MMIRNVISDSVPTNSNNRREARLLTLILRHRETPWGAKLIAACTPGYLLSPVQLSPSFIPIIGQMDDVAVLLLGMKLLTVVTPEGILRECQSRVTHPLVGDHARSLKTARSVARNLPEANLPEAICYPENISRLPPAGHTFLRAIPWPVLSTIVPRKKEKIRCQRHGQTTFMYS